MSVKRVFHRLLLSVVVAGAACSGSPRTASAPSSSHSIIAESEIPKTGTESALDLIRRIRPDFLQNRTAGPFVPPVVVTGGQRIGVLDDLKLVPASSLRQIRYYNIEEAKRKFGMQYASGVIELTYRMR
jgi:hypothetical protein